MLHCEDISENAESRNSLTNENNIQPYESNPMISKSFTQHHFPPIEQMNSFIRCNVSNPAFAEMKQIVESEESSLHVLGVGWEQGNSSKIFLEMDKSVRNFNFHVKGFTTTNSKDIKLKTLFHFEDISKPKVRNDFPPSR
ncbi:hypothetical protein NPIL_512841 [Nephila pilipes]|uniref:Uncharacterized protein n=1 Tax=Nephila pilipes TaxID=299642 RepID=A0A8X6QT52_NEPPI|nr:hypothetical protein NPIL_512841 [Nephila pilipes]